MRRVPHKDAGETLAASALPAAAAALGRFGGTDVSAAENAQLGTVTVSFRYKGRQVQVIGDLRRVEAAVLAEEKLRQGGRPPSGDFREQMPAVSRRAAALMMRDWIRAQIAMVKAGVIPFDGAFLGHIVRQGGQRLSDQYAQTGAVTRLPGQRVAR